MVRIYVGLFNREHVYFVCLKIEKNVQEKTNVCNDLKSVEGMKERENPI